MAGVRLTIAPEGLDAAITRLNALTGRGFHHELLQAAGAIAERGTRERIDEGKAGPDGTPWQKWSDKYAKTRRGSQSLLVADGGLLDSIAMQVNPAGTEVAVGSNLVYAAVHQFGGGELPEGIPASAIPARPYLGLSDAESAEILSAINAFIDARLT